MAALTGALLAIGAANTFSQFVGQRRAASGAKQQGDYQGSIYDLNASLADQRAADAIQRGREAEARSRGATATTLADQDVSYGAQGIDTSTGSAVDVRKNDQAMGELDALTIRNNARREAWGFNVEAAGYRNQADLARAAGEGRSQDLTNQSWGTLLSGAGDLANTYQKFGLSNAPSNTPRGSGSGRGGSSSNGGYRNGTASP